MITSDGKLNEAQLTILRLFDREMTTSELDALKDTLVDFLDQQLQNELDQVMAKKNITPQALPNLGIKDNRTAYLREIREANK